MQGYTENLTALKTDTARIAMENMQRNTLGVCVVTGADGAVVGIVTNGDLRRAFLKGATPDTPLADVVNTRALLGGEKMTNDELLALMRGNHIWQLPIVDNGKRFLRLVILSDVLRHFDTTKPAILGGAPAFVTPLPLFRPWLPPAEELFDDVRAIIQSGLITNHRYVDRMERRVEEMLGVEGAVLVSSGTAGLFLLLRCLELSGEVILPSMTFTASAHAILWNGLKPVFVDCDPETFNVDPAQVEKNITPNTSAIMAVHLFGNPCDVDALEAIARKHRLKLLFDSAHALGSKYKGRFVGGCGDGEVFSLSPTKTITTGEGGIITSNDRKLIERLRLARNYGILPNYDCVILGLNARVPELSAALGLKVLDRLDETVRKRNAIVSLYKKHMDIPGIVFQKLTPDSVSTFKDFNILVDSRNFRLTRDELRAALEKENINTRVYYSPPVHWQTIYSKDAAARSGDLRVTEDLSQQVLTLPVFYDMTEDDVVRVCKAVEKAYTHYKEVRDAFRRQSML